MNLRVFDLLRADLHQYESWAVDLPGHGRSPWWPEASEFEVQKAAVLAVLPPTCVLVGWSLGAKLAMAIAAEEPRRVRALVLIAASPKFAAAADWPHGMATQAQRAFDAALAQDWQRTLQDFIALQLRGSRNAGDSRAVIEEALASHGAPEPQALLAGMGLLERVDLRSLASKVSQPALLIAGQNDRVTPPAAADWLAQALPNARLVAIPRAGHAPMISHHIEVAEALRGLLQELRAGECP
jgi:pimeloyl-[acyl-carrier protein] methyl ester esterase